MRVWPNVVSSTAAVVITAVAGLVSTMLLARMLTVDQFGQISLLVVIVNGVSVFEGLRPVVIYYSVGGRIDSKGLIRYSLSLATVIGAVVSLLAIAVWYYASAAPFSLVGAVSLLLATAAFFPAAVYWGGLDAAGKAGMTALARSAQWVLIYLGFLICGALRLPINSFLCVMAAAQLWLLWYFRRKLRVELLQGANLSREDRRTVRRASIENVGLNVGAVTIGVADRFVVGRVLGSASLGLYSGAYEMATKPVAFVRGIAQALNPYLAREAQREGTLPIIWWRWTRLGLGMSVIGCAVVVEFREELVRLLLGANFLAASNTFGILALAFPCIVLGYASATYLAAHGDFRTQRNIYLIAAGALLALLPIASRRFGIEGAAAVYAIIRGADLVLFAVVVLKAKSIRQSASACFLLIVAAAILCAAWYGRGMLSAVLVACLCLTLASDPFKKDGLGG